MTTEKREPTPTELELDRTINNGYLAPEVRQTRVWELIAALVNENMAPALSAARDAALEEAALLCMARCTNKVTGAVLARLLREEKSRPVSVLPVEKVREAFDAILRASGAVSRPEIERQARMLGVDLDTKPTLSERVAASKAKCDHHNNPDCRHTGNEILRGAPRPVARKDAHDVD